MNRSLLLGLAIVGLVVLSQRTRRNPAPEDATKTQIREEWRAHGAVKRAIASGRLRRPRPGLEAHHPDYSKPMRIEWVTPKEHRKLHHRY